MDLTVIKVLLLHFIVIIDFIKFFIIGLIAFIAFMGFIVVIVLANFISLCFMLFSSGFTISNF